MNVTYKNHIYIYIYIYIIWSSKVKWSRYRPGVAQRVGRGIAPLFHDRGTRRGWVVSSTPRPHFTPGKDPVPTLQEAGWAPGPVWTGGISRPHRDSIPNRPARSQLLYRLSYPAHIWSSANSKTENLLKLTSTTTCALVSTSMVNPWAAAAGGPLWAPGRTDDTNPMLREPRQAERLRHSAWDL